MTVPTASNQAAVASTRRHARRVVGVWGHYYGQNLGDELVTQVVIQAIRDRAPDIEVRGFSLDPADTVARHRVPSRAITADVRGSRARPSRGWRRVAHGATRRLAAVLREPPHVWRAYRALRGVDQLIVAGSGQLLDQWKGPWGHPFTIYKWLLLARLTGTRVSLLSMGAGPLDTVLGRWFVRRAVNAADYISVRDGGSAQVLRTIGVRRPLPTVPDMALGLAEREWPQPPMREHPRPVVGINAMAHAHARYWGPGRGGDDLRYEVYVGKVACAGAALVRDGNDLVLFSSQRSADPPTLLEVRDGIRRDLHDAELEDRVAIRTVEDTRAFLDVVGECDVVVGTRYHCVLLPLLFGIPTVALAYHPKTLHLMGMLGQGRFCMDIDDFSEGDLLERTRAALSRRDAITRELLDITPPFRAAVEEQFDLVLSRAHAPLGAKKEAVAP